MISRLSPYLCLLVFAIYYGSLAAELARKGDGANAWLCAGALVLSAALTFLLSNASRD